jgi:hypothetical protein
MTFKNFKFCPQCAYLSFLGISKEKQLFLHVALLVTATPYCLNGPGMQSRYGRIFSHLSRPALGPTKPSVQSYGVIAGVEWPGSCINRRPHLAPCLKEQ